MNQTISGSGTATNDFDTRGTTPTELADTGTAVDASEATKNPCHQPDLVVWNASDDHWEELKNLRFSQGWKLAALSLGYAPIEDLITKLPNDAERRKYNNRLEIINSSATVLRSKTKLHIEINIDADAIKLGQGASPTVRFYDIVKFVDFFGNLPAAPVDSRMIDAANLWRTIDAARRTITTVPVDDRIAKAAQTRIDNSILKALLGIAIVNYKFIPVGTMWGGKNHEQTKDSYTEIEDDLKSVGLPVSANVIRDRLAEIVEHLDLKDSASDELIAFVEGLKKAMPAA